MIKQNLLLSVEKLLMSAELNGCIACLYMFWISFRFGITVLFHHCRICVADFKEADLFAPHPLPISHQHRKDPSWIGLKTTNVYGLWYIDSAIKNRNNFYEVNNSFLKFFPRYKFTIKFLNVYQRGTSAEAEGKQQQQLA